MNEIPSPPQQWKTFPRLHLLAWDTERPHLCLQIKHVTDFVMNILKAFPRGLTGSCQMYMWVWWAHHCENLQRDLKAHGVK